MTWAMLLAVLAAAACSPGPRRAFTVGFLEPVSPRAAAEARRLGLEVAVQAPAGAAVVSTAGKGGPEVTADQAELRLLAARAVAAGSAGVFLRLPSVPAGRDYLDYVEEWQAAARVASELLAVGPIVRGGEPAAAPYAAPAGAETRAWTFQGRRYVLLVNSSGKPWPLESKSLAPWRALFAVRSDPRDTLVSCGENACLPPKGVLWLEGRLLPGILP